MKVRHGNPEDGELSRFGGVVSDVFWTAQSTGTHLMLDQEDCQKIVDAILTFRDHEVPFGDKREPRSGVPGPAPPDSE